MKDFYKKYKRSIRTFVAKRVDDPWVAEELVNDIMLAGMKARASFAGKSSEFSWLCAIANHKIVDYYRKKKLKTILFSASPMFEEIADKSLSPERDVLKNELKDEIKKTFSEVSKGYEKLLRLKYVDGLSVKEISEKMGLTIKAVESRLMRARVKFRAVWNYDGRESKKNR